MNQETFDFTYSKQKQNEYKVTYPFDFQISNIFDFNLTFNNYKYNSVPAFQYSNDQNSSFIQQNFMKLKNNFDQNYMKKPKKKPIYKPHCKWSKEEDEKLKELVKEFGEKDWRHLAKKFEGRNSRQCRERWNYYLNPILKQGQWTIEEDRMILEKYQEQGPRWIEITKYFEHRTDAMIKNRFNYLIRNQKRNRKTLYNTDSNVSKSNSNTVSNENQLIPSDSSESNQSNEISSFLIFEPNFSDNSNDNELSFCNLDESFCNEMTNFDDFFNE